MNSSLASDVKLPQSTSSQTMDSVLRQTENLLRDLDDYKTSISFLEAELAEIDFKQ